MTHRQIRIVPTTENAEALKILFVLLDIAQGELTAQFAKFGGGNLTFSAEFLFDLRLDGQTVAIPPRNVGSVMSGHTFGLDDEVLEDLVKAGAKMNFTGGIRWAVVEHKKWFAFASFQDAFIDVAAVPGFELFWLVLREAGLHGEISFRQVECFLEFEWFGHRFDGSDSPFFNCITASLPSFRSGVRRETSEGNVSTYVTMKASRCQPFGTRNLSRPA